MLQEEKLVVLDEEIAEILVHLEENSSKERVRLLRQFLNQFDDNNNKRLVADFLRKFIVITNSDISDYHKKVRKEIWGNIELGLGERDVRTDAEIVCIPDSFDQNILLAESIRTSFKFVANKSIKRTSELGQLDTKVKHLIVFEPLIDCPYYYRNEISKLLKRINPTFVTTLRIHLLCYVITNEAKNEIEDYVSRSFAFDFEIHQLKSIERSDICPYLNSTESINDPTWRALSLYHSDSNETSCLVKVGDLVPYQCFPFLWNKSSDKFIPLYPLSLPVSVYRKRISVSEKLKEFNFNSENNQLEFKASLAEPATNWKEILKKCKTARSIGISVQSSEMLTEAENLWSLKQLPKEIRNAVKHSLAKTLAAFANTHGGEIFVGIEDDLTIQGLIYDMKIHKTEEEVRRAFDLLVDNYIGIENSRYIDLTFIDLGVPVLKISVSRADSEIWIRMDSKGNKLHQTKGEFYIRGQQETRLLSPQEFYDWKTSRS